MLILLNIAAVHFDFVNVCTFEGVCEIVSTVTVFVNEIQFMSTHKFSLMIGKIVNNSTHHTTKF